MSSPESSIHITSEQTPVTSCAPATTVVGETLGHWSGLTVRYLQTEAGWAALKAVWNALQERYAQQDFSSVFLRHEWLDAAWQWAQQSSARSTNPAQRVILLVYQTQASGLPANTAGQLVGAAALVWSEQSARVALRPLLGSIRTLEFLTVPDTQRAAVLCDPAYQDQVMQALASSLPHLPCAWDRLQLDYIPKEMGGMKTFRTALQRAGLSYTQQVFGTNWSVRTDTDWDAYYAARPRSLKKNNNLVQNRLEAAGALQIERLTARDFANAEAVLQRIAPISEASWKAGTGTTLAEAGPRAFMQRLTEHALAQDWLCVWLLSLNQQPLAYEYQIIFAGKVHALRSDFVQAVDETLSPGTYLNQYIMQRMFADVNIHEYCMGPGKNAYKLKWTETGEALEHWSVYAKHARGKLLYTTEKAVIAPLRKLLHKDATTVANPVGEPNQDAADLQANAASEPAVRTVGSAVESAPNKPTLATPTSLSKPTKPKNRKMSRPIVLPERAKEITRQGAVAVVSAGHAQESLRHQLAPLAVGLQKNAADPLPALQFAQHAASGFALGASPDTLIGHAQGEWGHCVVWGRPHLRSRMPEAAASVRDLQQTAAILERKLAVEGAQAFDVLRGEFSVIAVAHDARQVFLAVDPMGLGRLCYSTQRNAQGVSLWIASRTDCLRPVLQDTALNSQALYDYLFFHAVSSPHTLHRDIQTVPAGHAVHWRDGEIQTSRYWGFRFTEDQHDMAALKQEFIQVLESAHQPFAQAEQIGAFLSGGTDSSTVCGMLGRVSGKPTQAYSIGFKADGYDETEFAQTSAQHFGAQHHVYYVTPEDVLQGIDVVAQYYDQPFGNASAVPVYWCAKRAAESGVRLLLAGDGGDELFGGNARYATQWQFGLYDQVPAPLRSLLNAAMQHVPAGIPLLSKIASYVKQVQVPLPDRLHTYNLLEQIGTQTIFSPDFLKQVNVRHPYLEQQQIYQGTPGKLPINRLLWLDWKYTLADSDIPKVNGMCEAAGVQVAYPLLDDRVVEFSGKLTADMKLKRTYLRYFFKQALADFLPPATLTKSKHGFGLPFGVWLTEHKALQERAYASLRALDQRGFLADGFVNQLIQQHQGGHAGYYGTLIWVLMMLEAWFEKQK